MLNTAIRFPKSRLLPGHLPRIDPISLSNHLTSSSHPRRMTTRPRCSHQSHPRVRTCLPRRHTEISPPTSEESRSPAGHRLASLSHYSSQHKERNCPFNDGYSLPLGEEGDEPTSKEKSPRYERNPLTAVFLKVCSPAPTVIALGCGLKCRFQSRDPTTKTWSLESHL